jgi:hypothetical protein
MRSIAWNLDIFVGPAKKQVLVDEERREWRGMPYIHFSERFTCREKIIARSID